MLSNKLLKLEDQYSEIINFMVNEKSRLSDILPRKKIEIAMQIGSTISLSIDDLRLMNQVKIIESKISTYVKIISELKQLMGNPQLRSTERLLVANQALPEAIKNQIIKD